MRKIDLDEFNFIIERNKEDFVEVLRQYFLRSDNYGTHKIESLEPTYIKVLKETGKKYRVGVCRCASIGGKKLYKSVELIMDKEEYYRLKNLARVNIIDRFLAQYMKIHPTSKVAKSDCLCIDTTYGDWEYRNKPNWVEEVNLFKYFQSDGIIINAGK